MKNPFPDDPEMAAWWQKLGEKRSCNAKTSPVSIGDALANGLADLAALPSRKTPSTSETLPNPASVLTT